MDKSWLPCIEQIKDELPPYCYGIGFCNIFKDDSKKDRKRILPDVAKDVMFLKYIMEKYDVHPLYIRLMRSTRLTQDSLDNAITINLNELDLELGREPGRLLDEIDRFYRFEL